MMDINSAPSFNRGKPSERVDSPGILEEQQHAGESDEQAEQSAHRLYTQQGYASLDKNGNVLGPPISEGRRASHHETCPLLALLCEATNETNASNDDDDNNDEIIVHNKGKGQRIQYDPLSHQAGRSVEGSAPIVGGSSDELQKEFMKRSREQQKGMEEECQVPQQKENIKKRCLEEASASTFTSREGSEYQQYQFHNSGKNDDDKDGLFFARQPTPETQQLFRRPGEETHALSTAAGGKLFDHARVAGGACYRLAEYIEFSEPDSTYTKTAAKVNFFMNDAELEVLPHLTEYSMRRGRPGFVYLESELILAAEKKFGKQEFHQKRKRFADRHYGRQKSKVDDEESGVEVLETGKIKRHLESTLEAGLVGGKAGRTKFKDMDCSYLCKTIDEYLLEISTLLKKGEFIKARIIAEALTDFCYQRCERLIKNDDQGIFEGKISLVAGAWRALATVPGLSPAARVGIAKRLGRWGKRFQTLRHLPSPVFILAMAEVMQQLQTVGPAQLSAVQLQQQVQECQIRDDEQANIEGGST